MPEGAINTEGQPTIRPREVIEAEIKAVVEQGKEADKEANPWFKKADALPEDEGNTLEVLTTKLNEGSIDDNDLNGCSPQVAEIITAIKPIFEKAKVIVERHEALRQEAVPYLREDLQELAEDLYSRLDFDKALEYYTSGAYKPDGTMDSTLNSTFIKLHSVRRIKYQLDTDSDETRDYRRLEYGLERLQKLKAELGERGFLKDVPETQQTEAKYGLEVRGDKIALRDEIAASFDQFDKYARLARTYKPAINTEIDRKTLSDINFLLGDSIKTMYQNLTGDQDYVKFDVDPRFVEAARRYFDKFVGHYRQRGYLPNNGEGQTLPADESSLPSVIREVENTVPIEPDSVQVLSYKDINEVIDTLLPPSIAKRIKKITVKEPLPLETDKKDPKVVWRTRGQHHPETTEKEFVSGSIEMFVPVRLTNGSTPTEVELAKDSFLGTLYHEAGHTAAYTLNYNEMQAWEDVSAADTTDVTEYVKRCREESETLGKREDFAETFSMYLHRPLILYTLSPSRFVYMNEYFKSHLDINRQEKLLERQRNLILQTGEHWARMGYTAEDVRRMWFATY